MARREGFWDSFVRAVPTGYSIGEKINESMLKRGAGDAYTKGMEVTPEYRRAGDDEMVYASKEAAEAGAASQAARDADRLNYNPDGTFKTGNTNNPGYGYQDVAPAPIQTKYGLGGKSYDTAPTEEQRNQAGLESLHRYYMQYGETDKASKAMLEAMQMKQAGLGIKAAERALAKDEKQEKADPIIGEMLTRASIMPDGEERQKLLLQAQEGAVKAYGLKEGTNFYKNQMDLFESNRKADIDKRDRAWKEAAASPEAAIKRYNEEYHDGSKAKLLYDKDTKTSHIVRYGPDGKLIETVMSFKSWEDDGMTKLLRKVPDLAVKEHELAIKHKYDMEKSRFEQGEATKRNAATNSVTKAYHEALLGERKEAREDKQRETRATLYSHFGDTFDKAVPRPEVTNPKDLQQLAKVEQHDAAREKFITDKIRDWQRGYDFGTPGTGVGRPTSGPGAASSGERGIPPAPPLTSGRSLGAANGPQQDTYRYGADPWSARDIGEDVGSAARSVWDVAKLPVEIGLQNVAFPAGEALWGAGTYLPRRVPSFMTGVGTSLVRGN